MMRKVIEKDRELKKELNKLPEDVREYVEEMLRL